MYNTFYNFKNYIFIILFYFSILDCPSDNPLNRILAADANYMYNIGGPWTRILNPKIITMNFFTHINDTDNEVSLSLKTIIQIELMKILQRKNMFYSLSYRIIKNINLIKIYNRYLYSNTSKQGHRLKYIHMYMVCIFSIHKCIQIL